MSVFEFVLLVAGVAAVVADIVSADHALSHRMQKGGGA